MSADDVERFRTGGAGDTEDMLDQMRAVDRNNQRKGGSRGNASVGAGTDCRTISDDRSINFFASKERETWNTARCLPALTGWRRPDPEAVTAVTDAAQWKDGTTTGTRTSLSRQPKRTRRRTQLPRVRQALRPGREEVAATDKFWFHEGKQGHAGVEEMSEGGTARAQRSAQEKDGIS